MIPNLRQNQVILVFRKGLHWATVVDFYINDLEDIDPADSVNTCQYADDTTQYKHLKISQLQRTIQNTQERLNNLKVWSRNNNLWLYDATTKYIIFSSTKIKQNFLQDFEYSIDPNNNKVEKLKTGKSLV